MSKNNVDWVGQWYVVAKERGGNDMADMAKVNTATGEVHWIDFSHAEYDGAGALAAHLRQEGYRISQLPEIKIKSKPALWQRWKVLHRGLKAMKPTSPKWKEHNSNLRPRPHDLTWVTLSRAQTERLRHYSQEHKISRNALLLSLLNQEIRSELTADEEINHWLFPVNMRGAVKGPADTSNQSSFIPLMLSPTTNPEEIHAQVRSRLKEGVHWAMWWVHNIGRWVGHKGMRYLSSRSSQKSFWLGTYSDMGAWPPPGSAPGPLNPDEAWVFAPPGSENHPVGIVTIEWNGRLTISLKIHPSICRDRQGPEQMLEQVRQHLLQTIGATSAQRPTSPTFEAPTGIKEIHT